MHGIVRRLGAQTQPSVGTSTPVRSGNRLRPPGAAIAVLPPDRNQQRMGPAPGVARTCVQLCAAASRHPSSTSCATLGPLLAQCQQIPNGFLRSTPVNHPDEPPPRQASALTPPTMPPRILSSSPSAATVSAPANGLRSSAPRRSVIAAASRTSRTGTAGSPLAAAASCPAHAPSLWRSGPSTCTASSPFLPVRNLAAKPSSQTANGMPVFSDRPHGGRGTAAAAAAAEAGGGGGGSDSDSAAGIGSGSFRYTNRLVSEQSPYLLQHAHNPVDWYAWGEEAFARARAEDKPIFLSVGYATCHWCHVMERESFESEELADLMNRDFVCVKVDREERPDVDRVYMTYVQAVSGSGGWPMSVWLTPSLEPFYGGTYYPPKDRFIGGQLAMPGFETVLRRIASLWRTNRQDLKDKASTTLEQLTEALKEATGPGAGGAAAPAGPSDAATSAGGVPLGLTAALAGASVDACSQDLARRYDAEFGGFGGAPKFPRPSEINLMLRAASRQQEQGDPLAARRLQNMALHSLTAMASGGMYDQLGGGFHRYSVDELWHVPHFEKMLYDNPQLATSYLAAFQLTGEQPYAQVARGVLDYLLRDLTSPGGGLYSAEDADSEDPHSSIAPGAGLGPAVGGGSHPGGERKEGAFYIWDHAEIMSVLGPELGSFFCLVYGIDEEGNCNRSTRSDPHGEFEGKNVPYMASRPEVAAERLGLPFAGDAAEAARRLAAAREALHAARASRPRPSLDDKVVTSWNGMGIGAFALASRVLAAQQQVERLFPSEGRPAREYLHAAVRVAAFVRDNLWDPLAAEAQAAVPGEGRQGEGGAATAAAAAAAAAAAPAGPLTGRLRRSFCRGPSAVPGFADDYAALISGLLDLHESGGGREWLEWALQLQAVQDQLFWDSRSGGYFSTADPATSDADPSIRIRIKDDYDGAEPTASSVSASNLLRLADMVPERPAFGATWEMSYDEAAQRTLSAFTSRLTQAPLAVPQMCCAAHTFSKRPLRQVIVAGRSGAEDTGALLDAVHVPYCPDKVVLVMDPSDPRDMAFWRRHNPAAHDMVAAHFARQQPGSSPAVAAGSASTPPAATAFICQNYTCQAPTTDPDRVRALLGRRQEPPSSAARMQHFDITKL